MKKQATLGLTVVLLAFQSYCGNVWALPTTAYQAEKVVEGWLKVDAQPLGMTLGRHIKSVQTFVDDGGEPIYYIVYLQPSGFVIVSADDLVEPIVGFCSNGTYDPSLANPLGALVTNDLNGRIAAVRQTQQADSVTMQRSASSAQDKWNLLLSRVEAPAGEPAPMGLSSISDVRIEPMVQSKWNQQNICGSRSCYNYYTPQWVWDPYPTSGYAIWPEGSSNNHPCGCSATALAQLLRFHEHPNDPCEIGVHEIKVRGYIDENNFLEITESRPIRGGDGSGGPYDWSLMVLEPDCNTTLAQRQAIGALCYDAALALRTIFSEYGSFSSDADMEDIGITFKLSDGKFGANGGANIGAGLDGMINPNLDANHPVALAINSTSDLGHAVLADGYGYNSSTLYHHLNMGWSGIDDAWYDLPDFSAGDYSFNSVVGCFYNIFVTGTGEIISGRVTDTDGNPITGATVTAQREGGGTYNTTTNTKGIYALAKITSDSKYTITVTKIGYSFTPRIESTGISVDGENTSGNLWGTDFQGSVASIVFSPDFDGDGWVDLADFAFLASNWMRNDCNISNQWCHETDLYCSGNVDELDLAAFCDSWLTEVIDPDLLAYWPLDDNDSNTFVSDISGNGHNGTASANTSLLSAPGVVNTCFDFGGSASVVVSDNAAFSFDDSGTKPFSISAWIYVTSTGNQFILSKWDDSGGAEDREWQFYLDSATRLVFQLYDDNANKFGYVYTKAVLSNGWHHVVGTYDSRGGSTCASGITLYVDGSAISSGDTTIVQNADYVSMQAGGTDVVIGARRDGGGVEYNFADKIDNVLIFSKCLTATEITALYGEGL